MSLIVVAAGILVATGGEGDDDNGVSDAEQRIAEAREGSATTDAPTSAPTTTAPAPVAGETDRAVQRRLEFFMNFELSYYYSHGGRWATTSEQILDNYMANYSGLRTPEYLPVSAVIEAPVPVLPPTVVVTQVRDKTLFTASVSEGGTCLYKRFTPGNNAPGNEYARHRGTPCPSVFDVGYNGDSSAWYRG